VDPLLADFRRLGRRALKATSRIFTQRAPLPPGEPANGIIASAPSADDAIVPETAAQRRAFWEDFYAPANPWLYEGNAYETVKYQQTLSLLPPRRIAKALELGCAEGHFSTRLAAHVDQLIAADISPTAAARTRARCADLPNIDVRVIDVLSDDLPSGLDLLVCSETLYCLPRERLPDIAQRFAAALQPGGALLMANALTITDERDHTGFDWGPDSFGAKTISDAFSAHGDFALEIELRTPLYRIHRFRRLGPGVAASPSPEIVEAALAADIPARVEASVIWDGAICTRTEAQQQAPATQVPILMYHNIADDGHPQLSRYRVSPAAFREQMRHLRRHGYHSISVAEWVDCIASGRPVPGRPVIITFDDACKSFITHAAPILEAAGFRATIFVVTGKVGGTADWDADWPPLVDLMDWDDLRDLLQRGFEIAGHTTSHANLLTLSDDEIVRDSIETRAALHEQLGIDATSIAFPFGLNDARVRAALARGGYRVALADDGFCFSGLGDDLMCLPRVGISGHADLGAFARRLETPDRSVTLCITSAGRPDLLRRTLRSLLAANASSFRDIIIADDLASEECAAVVRELCPDATFLFNDPRLGHHRSVDRLYSHVRTPFIFQCEDDWEFDPVPIVDDCFEALLATPDASGVFVRAQDTLSSAGLEAMEGSELRDIEGRRYVLGSHASPSIWTGFAFSPNLLRRSLWEEHGPYEKFAAEVDISRHMKARGLRCILRLDGTCHHIGDERHVDDPFQAARPG
jgi:peptidoglycan/xylan/chitin deacetylase (PgdA/CDA1 family)/SAM-dependent methyltransferase